MNPYKVEIDGVVSEVRADSLAELSNIVRGKGRRIKVWSPVGVMLIDTLFGDVYYLITNS